MELMVMLLILLMSSISAERRPSEIKQMYPLDPDYCCHCPAIELQCTFSESPLNAYWSYQSANGVSEDVTSETTGHTVDESMMHQGILYLHVNASVHLKNKMYTCTALYNGGRDLEAETSVLPFMTPMEENLSALIHNFTIVQVMNTLFVTWGHDYYMCRNFTILLNGTAVSHCTNITALNCSIIIEPGMSYNVSIRTTESGQEFKGDTLLYKTVPLDQPTDFCSTVPGICIWLPVLSLSLILLALILVVIIVIKCQLKHSNRLVNKAKVWTQNGTGGSTVPADAI